MTRTATVVSSTSANRPAPADGLLNPVALAAVLLLVVNDHFLKAQWPGTVTGKLSDFAGLAFFPLVLLGFWEVALALARRWSGPRLRTLVAATTLTAVAFIAVKTTAAGASAFGLVLAFGQWLPAALGGVVTGRAAAMGAAAPVAQDPTDLVALPALLVALFIGRRRLARGDGPEA